MTFLIILLSGVALFFGIYLIAYVSLSDQRFWLLLAGPMLITALGLMLRKPWSQYLWYGITFILSASWVGYTIWLFLSSGWPYPDLLLSYISLLPGLLVMTVWIGGSITIYRYFHDDA
jgi:hypothetical protein